MSFHVFFVVTFFLNERSTSATLMCHKSMKLSLVDFLINFQKVMSLLWLLYCLLFRLNMVYLPRE